MARYWLTPVDDIDPLVLGSDRIPLAASESLAAFRSKLQQVHPRLLLLFKASLLLSDEALDDSACGTGEEIVDLSRDGAISFASDSLRLSSCADAFLARLLSAKETKELVEKALAWDSWNEEERSWLTTTRDWADQNRLVMLIRED